MKNIHFENKEEMTECLIKTNLNIKIITKSL